jgi:hypothetical protein
MLYDEDALTVVYYRKKFSELSDLRGIELIIARHGAF